MRLGYGLTFGVHSRIDETIALVDQPHRTPAISMSTATSSARSSGVQPFGGHGLSGTGPKAGGPLYLRRLLADARPPLACLEARRRKFFRIFLISCRRKIFETADFSRYGRLTPLGAELTLPGPVGEQNQYLLPTGPRAVPGRN